MIKLDKKIVVMAVLLGLAGAGYLGWKRYFGTPSDAQAAPPATHKTADTLHFDASAPQLTFIRVEPVEALPEPLVEPLNARIAYDDNHTARVFSPVNGRVVKILAEAGQPVRAGDGLLEMDAPEYAQAAADVAKADADLLRSKEVLERARLLYEAKGVAQKDLELAEADWHQAEAEAVRARARLRNLNGNGHDAGGTYVLRAPLSGTLTERQVSAGSEVRPDASNSLFVIADTSHVWVLVDMPELALGKVSVGQKVLIQVDAYPGESFLGTITVIG
ncbi:MAG: efflux RND transporter periplasmic adaptor subunit, partial [Gallionella sp.]|nr:efflux RND transporter periplasmic adaptor subunit [Gallionella sp.]